MKIKKITALILVLLLSLPQGIAFAESSAEDTAETSFNFDEYVFTDPIEENPKFPTDEEFFGEWDGTDWVKTPELDYSYISKYGMDLSEVESCVKEGNYQAAKEKLLEYYRFINDKRGLTPLTPSIQTEGIAKLMLYNMHDMAGGSYRLADIFEVTSQEGYVEVEMLDQIDYYIELGGKMPIGLYALEKDDCEAVFYSKEAQEQYRPCLELTVDGQPVTIFPDDDTYIAAGSNKNENYGDESYLRCREASVGQRNPVNSDTRRAFLMFDLSGYTTGNDITYAKLKLYGSWEQKSGEQQSPDYRKKVAAIADINTNWAEDNLTYMSNATDIFSYEGEFGTTWRQPDDECNPDQVYEEHLIRFAWLSGLTTAYADSKDETYARAFFMYFHDFINKTFSVYRGMPGSDYEIPTWPTNITEEDQKTLLYGGYSKSLDLSVRATNISLNFPYYYNSEYLTADMFCMYLKYMWSMGNVLARFFGRSEKAGNWGNYSNYGLYCIIAYYPEFRRIREESFDNFEYRLSDDDGYRKAWMDILLERIEYKCGMLCLPDGSSEEGSTSYTLSNITNLYRNKELADSLDETLEFTDGAKEGLRKLAQYGLGVLLPWGGDPGFGDCVTHTSNYYDALKNVGEWIGAPELIYPGTNGKEGEKPDFTSKYWDYYKSMVMRSDWRSDALYLYTSSSGSPYSHNHWNDLGVIAAAYGEYLLIDPGFYSLTPGDPNRRWLYSSRGHNTIEINDYCQKTAMQTAGDGQIGTGEDILPRGGSKGDIQLVEINDAYNFARVTTDNYKDIAYGGKKEPKEIGDIKDRVEPGMDCHRDILFLNPNFWIVSDYMNPIDDDGPDGDGNKYTQIWHTLPEANLSISGNPIITDFKWGLEDIDTEITEARTSFAPGDSGILKTNMNSRANMLVVPADTSAENGVVPKILRGYYSPMKGSITNTPYGVFEKTVKGTTTMDTILFPTRAGEKYDIKTTPLTLSLPQGAGSAFSADIKDVSGMSNENYSFTYYVLHEEESKGEVVFGGYKTDGMLAYYEKEDSGKPRRSIIKEASYVYDNENEFNIVYSTEEIEDLAVEWVNSEIVITTSDEFDLSKLTVYSPQKPDKVMLNDTDIEFNYTSSYVHFEEEPILNGDSIVLPTPPSADDTDSVPDDTTVHGKPSDSTGGGGGGGGGAIGNEEKPENKDDAQNENSVTVYEKELENHWGKSEIESLIKQEIVKGDGNTLNLKSDITRAEFTAMVLRALNIEEAPYKNAFSDVSEKDWYAGIMQSAYDKGIITGTDRGAEPNAPLTREQAVKIIITALEAELSDDKEHIQFKDTDEISDWAKDYVSKAVSMGIINGMGDGCFAPKGTTLREQAMVMIYRILNLEEETIK